MIEHFYKESFLLSFIAFSSNKISTIVKAFLKLAADRNCLKEDTGYGSILFIHICDFSFNLFV